MSSTALRRFRLSPSTLSVFRDCPRCFWLAKVKAINRPRGIFPSLPGGMDRIIKDYFDSYRSGGLLPPELHIPEFDGIHLFEDQAQLDLWRNWKTGPSYKDKDGSVLFGALDDLLLKGQKHIPFDYKTKGSPASEESAVRYYQNQLDCYSLMLQASGRETTDYGYLLFYSPEKLGTHGQVVFQVQPIKIQTSAERAKKVFQDAVTLLNGPMPEPSAACEYCGWLGQLGRLS